MQRPYPLPDSPTQESIEKFLRNGISYCRSLRLERSGRKQSRVTPEIAFYRRNDEFSIYKVV